MQFFYYFAKRKMQKQKESLLIGGRLSLCKFNLDQSSTALQRRFILGSLCFGFSDA